MFSIVGVCEEAADASSVISSRVPGKPSSFSLGILRQMIDCLVSKDLCLAKLIVSTDEGLAICRLMNLVSSRLY